MDFAATRHLAHISSRIAMNLSLNARAKRKRFRLRLVSRDASPGSLAEPTVSAANDAARAARPGSLGGRAQLG
ncbi:MAG: hypothetical protein IPP90_23710 [Gemmatimonadaceae bacterium]|nr:hypothetical protein [Gemmatimonadaceae bacterium]